MWNENKSNNIRNIIILNSRIARSVGNLQSYNIRQINLIYLEVKLSKQPYRLLYTNVNHVKRPHVVEFRPYQHVTKSLSNTPSVRYECLNDVSLSHTHVIKISFLWHKHDVLGTSWVPGFECLKDVFSTFISHWISLPNKKSLKSLLHILSNKSKKMFLEH